MHAIAERVLSLLLGRTPLGLIPVRVRSGIAAGARWTLFPRTSYWRGTHEPELQPAFLALGGGDILGWVCWDVGAHYGLYSIGLARRVGPTGQVAAFEPDPRSFARLERHRRMNRLAWLKTYCAAVSDHDRGAELYTYGQLGITTTHLPYDNEARTAKVGALQVATVRLDDLVERGEIRAPRFVKIDVEGHGHHVIDGMRRTLAGALPILIVEFHSEPEIRGVMSALQPLRYTWRHVSHPEPCPVPTVGNYLFTPPEPPPATPRNSAPPRGGGST